MSLPLLPRLSTVARFTRQAGFVLFAALSLSAQVVQLPNLNDLAQPPARVPIFYPPSPPAPQEGIDRIGPLQHPGWDPPPAVAPHVGELFYPSLAALLAEQRLPRKPSAAIAHYTAARSAALLHLRARLAATPFRENSGQSDELSALELAAEKLRTSLLEPDLTWGRFRSWGVGARDSSTTPAQRAGREFAVLRAAVFDFPELSPGQCRLLWEFILLPNDGRTPPSAAPVPRAVAGATIFFSPATARLNLPTNLDSDLAAEFDAFLAAKHALQREIAAAVIAGDSTTETTRHRDLLALARRHEPRLTDLERLAEQLRVRLAALPPPAAPPALPSSVLPLVQTFQRERAALRQTLADQLRVTRRELGDYLPGQEQLRWESNFQSGGFIDARSQTTIELQAIANETQLQFYRTRDRLARLTAATERWTIETAARNAASEDQRRRLFAATVRALFPALDPATPPDGRQLAHAALALRAEELRERQPLYIDYETATRRPGLTPAERRLLFNAAVVGLDLPLPPGSRRPVGPHEAP